MNFLFGLAIPFISALLISAVLIPCWIRVCHKWHLFETTDDRKKHKVNIPSMGGLPIFAGIFISFMILGDNTAQFSMMIAAAMILFFTGFFDDLLDLPAMRKLLLQIFAASLVVSQGSTITGLFGLFGIESLPVIFQYPVTVIFIVAITNAYNLVDGIDGLAGSLGAMSALIFGALFYDYGRMDFAILSFCTAGALIGFLFYNFHPARIFMGDTGSLIIGFLLAVQAVNLLSINEFQGSGNVLITPALIVAVLFVPVYDVLRVSVIRMITGNSPFRPDRNHVHHMIIRQGFGQRVTTILIVAINMIFVMLSLIFSSMNINLFMLMSICLGMITINTLVMNWMANLYGKLGGRIYNRVAAKQDIPVS